MYIKAEWMLHSVQLLPRELLNSLRTKTLLLLNFADLNKTFSHFTKK